ncbi:hypothetical protein C8R47DRAFT_1117214 [Mycena vitilis]|nr:hypothetical protein C8R47DRAFT_1117214 [Mycena vitilis]
MKSFAWVAVFVSIMIWRSRRSARYMFIKRQHPASFYEDGNADTKCVLKTAPDMRFCEDAAFWDIHTATNTTRREVIVSCDPGRKDWNTVLGPLHNPKPHGALWLLSGGEDGVPQRITLNNYPANHDFHPLGIAISPSHGNAPSNLFAVNHAREKTVIEQFTISNASPGVATHVRTISSPYFVSPNSITLTSPLSFYVSNDHLLTRRGTLGNILPLLETVLALPLSWVAHVTLSPDPASSTPILEHKFSALFIPFANGVSVSPCGSQVAVASTSLSQVHFYSRDPASDALTHTHTVPVPFLADNLEFDSMGTLIVAGHPDFLALLKVKADPGNVVSSPSWVVAINPTRDVETLFQSDGSVFSSSSTGLRDPAGTLYVTGLYEPGVLVCRP